MTEDPAMERYKLEQTRKGGASWFLWIGALSVINTILVLTETDFNFIFGLGITQFVDGLVSQTGPVIRAIGVGFNILIAAAFAGIWHLAKRHTWPFVTGMVFYAGDTLIFLLVQEWLGLAFHVFALASMVAGYKAAVKLSELPPQMIPAAAPPAPAV